MGACGSNEAGQTRPEHPAWDVTATAGGLRDDDPVVVTGGCSQALGDGSHRNSAIPEKLR